MKKQILVMLLSLPVLAGAGCATSSDMDRVDAKLAGISSQLGQMRADADEAGYARDKEHKEAMARLDSMDASRSEMSVELKRMADELETIKRNQANLGSRMESVAGGEILSFGGQLDELRYSLEQTNSKLDSLKAAIMVKIAAFEESISGAGAAGAGEAGYARPEPLEGMTLGGQAGADKATSTPPVEDPKELYNAAYLDYTKGNYELALMGFKEYLREFPDAEYAPNGQYWVAESLYSLGHYQEALIEFERVTSDYPTSTKVPGAILKKGYCFIALGRPQDAEAAFREVVEKYPGTSAAQLAEEKLKPETRGRVPEKRR